MAQPVTRTGRRKRAPKLDIRVLESDIAAALPQDSRHCMIADALRREIPTARKIAVDLATIRYTDSTSGRRFVYLNPRNAQLAMLDFDQGVRPDPFGVAAYAAQIIEPRPKPADGGRRKRQPAVLVPSRPNANQASTPAKEGGRVLPIGPMARGAGSNKAAHRTGATRQFGLSVMGR